MIITVIGAFELPGFALSAEEVSAAEKERLDSKYKNKDDSEEEKYNNYQPVNKGKTVPTPAKAEEEEEKDLKAVNIASGKIENKKPEEEKPAKPLPAVVETPAVKTPSLPERIPVVATETAKKEEVTDDMRQASGLTLVETVPDRSNTGFIKNPLPVPKPHVTRELTYDYDFKDEDLDFDITDMKGKDYYDI